MQKYFKKTLAGIFAVAIVASSVPLAPYTKVLNSISITASAYETEDGLVYEENEEGTLTITGYNGTSPDVVIPAKIGGTPVTVIGEEAFHGTGIQTIVLNEGLKGIEARAFWESSITSVTFPKSLCYIGASAFYFCENLEYVRFLNSNCEMRYEDCFSPFIECENDYSGCFLKTVYCPTGSSEYYRADGFFDLDEGACGAWTFVEESLIPDSTLTWEIDENGVMTISGDDEAFPAFSDEMGNWTHWCDAYSNVTSIVFETPHLTSIGSGAFADFTGLTSLELPDTVESIGKDAFNNCSSLASVELPAALLSLGQGAFFGCSALEEVVLPSAVTTIGQAAFGYCSKLISATIPKSVKSIDIDLFYECQAMETVNYTGTKDEWDAISIGISNSVLNSIPMTYNYRVRNTIPNSTLTYEIDDEGVLTITGDDEAFPECLVNNALVEWCDKKDEVKEIVFATPKLKNLSSAALYDFENLTSVKLPETLTSIGYGAFGNCSALTQIVIPDTVTSIGDSAFYGCSALTEIKIPDSVTSIGNSAFCECTALKEAKISDHVTSISEEAFYGCGSLTEIKIPDSVISIGRGAFGECSALTEIKIPGFVISIGDSAFCECSALTEITIPDSVTSIGDEAFWNCSALTEVTFECDVADAIEKFNSQGNSDIFDQSALETIYVPAGCVDSYKNSDGYKAALGDYLDLIQEMPTAELKGNSVSYNGDITINFHYLVSDSYKNGYVEFSDGTQVIASVSAFEVKDANGYFVFPISMPAKNMYDEITAQFYDANDVAIGEKVEFTLTGYMKEVKEYDPNYSDFVDSFLEYGRQAVNYFRDDMSLDAKTYSDDEISGILNDLETNGYDSYDMPEEFVGATLLLKSTPILRLYFKEEFDADGYEWKTNDNEGLHFDQKEIALPDFGTAFHGYSIFHYIYRAISSTKTDPDSLKLKSLCAALYEMNAALK